MSTPGGGHADEVAGLGEGGALVVAVGGGDGEDAGEGGGVGQLLLAGSAVVAGGGDHDGAFVDGVLDGSLQVRAGLEGLGGVLGDVDDVGAVLDCVVDGVGHGARGAAALGVVLADGDDGGLGGDADEAGAGDGAGGDDAGDLGAVADGVVGAVAAGGDVVLAADVGVDGLPELAVVVVDAGVDDGDLDAGAAGVLPHLVEEETLEGPGLTRDVGATEVAGGVGDRNARVVGAGVRGGGRGDGQA
jgi:hypothetical protein